jgi:hypothetical protein
LLYVIKAVRNDITPNIHEILYKKGLGSRLSENTSSTAVNEKEGAWFVSR